MSESKNQIVTTRSLTFSQKEDLLTLWNNEYPAHLKHENIESLETYFQSLSDLVHFIVCNADSTIKAWLVTFTRDDDLWFAMIVDRSLQGLGVGSALLDAAKAVAPVLNGWATDHSLDVKADGTPYPSPIAFYLKNGFEVLDNVRLKKGQLSVVKIRW